MEAEDGRLHGVGGQGGGGGEGLFGRDCGDDDNDDDDDSCKENVRRMEHLLQFGFFMWDGLAE